MTSVGHNPIVRLAGIILRIIGYNFGENNSRIIGCAQA